MRIAEGDSMKQMRVDLTVPELEMAIQELLSAHKAVSDAWFKDWEFRVKRRIQESQETRQESAKKAA
jgi:hypothetical protein